MSLDRDGSVKALTHFHVSAKSEIRHVVDLGAQTFATLSDERKPALKFDDIFQALQASFCRIEHHLQSSWGEHIPFLFSLISLLKPRSFVELGVGNGGSFLAACQVVKHLHLKTTCVAIDNWVGDAHSGTHDAGIFQEFRERIAREYSAFAGYICANFDDAIQNFAPGSIDMLHIDGFHTANAVKHDFETWCDKLSGDGVVLFHDTNEFRSDFGVWHFWHKIRDRYPYLEFGHGHGLGVLIVGKDSPLRKTVDGWSMGLLATELNELLQVLYSGIGNLSWTLAGQPPASKMTELVAKLAAQECTIADLTNSAKCQELTIADLRNVTNAQERIIGELRSSTSWRMTAPLRALSFARRRLLQSMRNTFSAK
jgi:hypothetical protein